VEVTVGALSFPTGFRLVVVLSLLCSGPAAACVVKDVEERPAFADEGPMHWRCVSHRPGKTETAQGDVRTWLPGYLGPAPKVRLPVPRAFRRETVSCGLPS